jgi:hypothetical protein
MSSECRESSPLPTRRWREPDSNRWSLAERSVLGRVSKKSVEQQLDAKDEAGPTGRQRSQAMRPFTRARNLTSPQRPIVGWPDSLPARICKMFTRRDPRLFARDRWFESTSLRCVKVFYLVITVCYVITSMSTHKSTRSDFEDAGRLPWRTLDPERIIAALVLRVNSTDQLGAPVRAPVTSSRLGPAAMS